MSTSTNDEGGEKKPPNTPLRGREALEWLRQTPATESPEEQALRSESARPRVTRFYEAGSSGDDSVRLVKTGTGNRKLTKNDRITLWVRLISGIPKYLADLHNAEIDAQLAEQQSSSESGNAPQGSSGSGNNQSTQNRLREESQGQNKKSWLGSFQSWLRRKSMATQAPGGGESGVAAPASATAAPAAPAAAGAPAARTTATTTAPAAPRSAAPAFVPVAVPSSSWDKRGGPAWVLAIIAIVALVVILGIIGYTYYCFRDQTMVNEIKDAQRMRERVVEDQLTFEKRRAEAEDNSAEIQAQGGVITRDPPVFQYIYNIPATNPPSGTTRTEATNQQSPQASAPATTIVTNNFTVVIPPSLVVIIKSRQQMHYSFDRRHWSGGYSH